MERMQTANGMLHGLTQAAARDGDASRAVTAATNLVPFPTACLPMPEDWVMLLAARHNNLVAAEEAE